MGRYEILEHTADVGLGAEASSLAELFQSATQGLAEIAGLWRSRRGEEIRLEVAADDLGALLVDWLGEVLYLHDGRGAAIGGVEMSSVGNGRATGIVTLVPYGDEAIEGIQIKAVTYHQLMVEETSNGWRARVFFDV